MSKSFEILDKGSKYSVPDAFNKPRSHFYATNSMLNYQYGGPMLNSVKHVFGEGGFKSMAKNIPSPYQFAGTKIYRDTTEIPSFKQGGNLEQPWLNNLYPNGGQLYTYAARPEAVYQKDDKGNWLIKLPSTNGQFVPLNDPTGKRAGELNEKAVLDPSQFRKQYNALEDIQPQVAENSAIPNAPKADASIIDKTIAYNQAVTSAAIQRIQSSKNLTSDQKAAILSDPEQIKGYELAVTRPDAVKAYTPTQQSFGNRMADIAFNPMTSLGYWMRGQEIPDNLQRRLDYGFEDRNPLDIVTDVTPVGALHSANNIYTKATDDIDGNFWTTNTALDVANILPTAKLIRSGMKGFTPRNSFNAPAVIPRLEVNPNVAIDFGRQTYPIKGAVGLTDETLRVPEGTPQNNLSSSLGNLRSFGNEIVGSLVNRNRAASLREAEDWMTNWMQHPITQQKIQNSYTTALDKGKVKYFPDGRVTLTKVKDSPIDAHNLAEGIKFSSGYDATGRLGEYPLWRQLVEQVELGKDNIHKDNIHKGNIGVSYTHGTRPGDWIEKNSIYSTVSPFTTTAIESSKKTPFSRYGNWISRTLDPTQRTSTGIHELTHDAIKAPTLRSTDLSDTLIAGIDPQHLNDLIQKHKDNPDVLANIGYYSDPTEIHARVMQTRKQFGLTPEDVVTPKQASKMMNRIQGGYTSVDPQFGKLFTDNDRTANMFNKAWMAPAAIAGGTAATLLSNPWASDKQQPMGLRQGGPFQTSYYSSDVRDNYYAEGGSLPKPYSLPEDSFKQGGRGLHNSIYASTPGQYPQPYENGGSLVANSAMPMVEPMQPNIIPASAFNAPIQFHPQIYGDVEKSDGTTYKKSVDGAWYISGPRAKNYELMHDPAGIWADSLETGIRQAKVVPVSRIPIVDN